MIFWSLLYDKSPKLTLYRMCVYINHEINFMLNYVMVFIYFYSNITIYQRLAFQTHLT